MMEIFLCLKPEFEIVLINKFVKIMHYQQILILAKSVFNFLTIYLSITLDFSTHVGAEIFRTLCNTTFSSIQTFHWLRSKYVYFSL